MMTGGVAGERRIHVVQGRHEVSADPAVCLTTILGSCVSACLWDPVAGVGGMNHFLLPEAPNGASGDRRYGVQAMELLINGLLKQGARRDRVQAKVFGGARMAVGVTDIGAKNGVFARKFLADEGIPVIGVSLGGEAARRIQFWPVSGRARQHVVDRTAIKAPERSVPVAAPADAGELELF